MSDEQLDALILWAPNAITERQFWSVCDRAEEAFPDVHPDVLTRVLGRIYGIPV